MKQTYDIAGYFWDLPCYLHRLHQEEVQRLCAKWSIAPASSCQGQFGVWHRLSAQRPLALCAHAEE